ncbi:uncharacterized protein LOC125025921 [Penaeus chinensis]|uniref:uncharacterized protein LOC125025921 n=1 Tax=Penaeus chinensis TaxID=139456 RepID=UPI001FB709A9|nr:uncharacterized protein LOC125025921 [Penaeus chinensis]
MLTAAQIMINNIKEMKGRKPQLQLGIKSKDGVTLHNDEDITKKWEEYIEKELFKDDRKDPLEIGTKDNMVSISQQEVEDTIKQLPKNKALGEDNLPAEFFKEL